MLLALVLLLAGPATAQSAAPAEQVTITVLATTDVHGSLYPYDYYTRQPAARGLAAAATLIAEVRRVGISSSCSMAKLFCRYSSVN